jgi:signal transduction histidine kinase
MSLSSSDRAKNLRGPEPVSALSAYATHGYSDAHEAAQAIFGLIREVIGLRVCVLTRIDLEANILTVLDASDAIGLGVVAGMVLPADSMPCACVVRDAAALREFDLDAHPAFSRLPVRAKLGLRSNIGDPLRRSDGTIWGTLAAADTRTIETTEGDIQTLTVLSRLAALEFEREEYLAKLEALEDERLQAARVQAVLEAAATVSHEVNNPLTVLQLRLARLAKRLAPDPETADDLEVALQAAEEIHQVTVQLRNVVRPVSTHYLSADTRMLDLRASLGDEDEDARLERGGGPHVTGTASGTHRRGPTTS